MPLEVFELNVDVLYSISIGSMCKRARSELWCYFTSNHNVILSFLIFITYPVSHLYLQGTKEQCDQIWRKLATLGHF